MKTTEKEIEKAKNLISNFEKLNIITQKLGSIINSGLPFHIEVYGEKDNPSLTIKYEFEIISTGLKAMYEQAKILLANATKELESL
ncbi:MAG: hypothetical protein KGZ97_12120 [Bacteroidetes bacterium]|nr:hypothetical protein [Bacteroidota bacterium]